VSSEGQPVPEGYATVAPWIVTRDTAREIEFLTAAFDGEELGRVHNEDGSIGHAEVRIGDFVVLLFDAKDDWPDTPALLRLYTKDVDEVFEKALRAGATSVTELFNSPWGDRGGRVCDPLGNIWWLTERIEDVEPDVQAQRWADPGYLESMRYAQESLDEELSRRRASDTPA
jgi:PhnB protein